MSTDVRVVPTVSVSLPAPPVILIVPVLAVIVSLPAPPETVSSPVETLIMSFPAPPVTLSSPVVVVMVSAPAPPVTVIPVVLAPLKLRSPVAVPADTVVISVSSAVVMVRFWSPVISNVVTPAAVVCRSLIVLAVTVLFTVTSSMVLVAALTTKLPPCVTP